MMMMIYCLLSEGHFIHEYKNNKLLFSSVNVGDGDLPWGQRENVKGKLLRI